MLISRKASEELGLKPGDYLGIMDENGSEHGFEVAAVVESYLPTTQS